MSFVFNIKASYRVDWLNIGILVLLFGSVLLLVSPAHRYSVTDDWAYAHAVQDMVHLNYSPSEWSMATALSHVAWGAVFVALFGFNFTVLTASNLVLSLIGIVLFYLLLRQLGIVPAYALFGATVLLFNPIYVYLSYSYMTDVPFVTYSTAALLCYVIGIKRKNQRGSYGWLVAGGLFAGLAYLVRQLGALLIIAILIYLLWESLKPLQIKRIIAAIFLPCLVIILYGIWASAFPLTLVAYVQASYRAAIFSNFTGWLWERLIQLAGGSFLLGLILLPLLSLNLQTARRRLQQLLWIVLVFSVICCLLSLGYHENGAWVGHNYGNILDNTGFLMQYYHAAPLFNSTFWFLLALISALAVSIFIVAIVFGFASWVSIVFSRQGHLSAQPVQNTDSQDYRKSSTRSTNKKIYLIFDLVHKLRLSSPEPRAVIILWGLITLIVTGALSYVTTDRYWLAILPALITVALTSITIHKKDLTQLEANQRPSLLRWALVGGMALVTLVGQQDYMARATARWEAGEQLIAQGVPPNNIYTGIEWTGWYLSDEGLRYFRQHGAAAHYVDFNPAEAIIDPIYLASETPIEGYTVVRSIAYQSFLRGGQGHVLILERNSAK